MEWTDSIEGAVVQREKVIYGFVSPAFCLKTINIKDYTDSANRKNINQGMNVRQKANQQNLSANTNLKRFFLFSTKPSLSKLYIEPTTQCNLQCRTCIRNSWDEPIGSMDMAVYRKLISDIKEFSTLNALAFWGIGEPLAHPEIVNMVALAHEMGLKTEVITNGHLLDEYMAKGFIQAGLDTLVVSVDGTINLWISVKEEIFCAWRKTFER